MANCQQRGRSRDDQCVGVFVDRNFAVLQNSP